jgi:DNA-binding HxlR family transcriptional regulator
VNVEVSAHAPSETGPAAGNQAVSGGWDRDLVPDAYGETTHPEPTCPVEAALAAVSGRWTTLLLRELMHGPRSFGRLRAALPALSAKVLSESLTRLTANGLVECRREKGFPSHTVYRLTTAGRTLRPLLIELYRTGGELLRETGGRAAFRRSAPGSGPGPSRR